MDYMFCDYSLRGKRHGLARSIVPGSPAGGDVYPAEASGSLQEPRPPGHLLRLLPSATVDAAGGAPACDSDHITLTWVSAHHRVLIVKVESPIRLETRRARSVMADREARYVTMSLDSVQ